MNVSQWISTYDHPNSVILLEGKRNVLDTDKKKLVSLGKLLAEKTLYSVFRSGNAKGADEYFCEGVALVDASRVELVTPYSSHRKTARKGLTYTALDEVDIAQEPEVVYASSFNKSNKRLIDRYVSGSRDRVAMKAAYLLRDTVKVLGTSSIAPTTFAFFYDDLTNPKSGGTGHTMEVCEKAGVDYFDQSVWMDWVGKS